MRNYGSRPQGGSARSDLPSLAAVSAQRANATVSTELSVLRTALRRLGTVGLQVFDMWAESADADELEWANDNVKPILDQLQHLPLGGPEGK